MSSVLLLKHWYHKYPLCCLTCDRTLLPVNSHQSWKRGGESERFGQMLYSSLSLGICVCLLRCHLLNGRTTALNPSVSKARGVTSNPTAPAWHYRLSIAITMEELIMKNSLPQPNGWIRQSIDRRAYLEYACVSMCKLCSDTFSCSAFKFSWRLVCSFGFVRLPFQALSTSL